VTFAGGRAYVTSGDDGLLRVHALDGRLLRTTRVPFGSFNVQEGWRLVLSPSLSLGTLSTVRPGGASSSGSCRWHARRTTPAS
jgi:hypothetical protein